MVQSAVLVLRKVVLRIDPLVLFGAREQAREQAQRFPLLPQAAEPWLILCGDQCREPPSG